MYLSIYLSIYLGSVISKDGYIEKSEYPASKSGNCLETTRQCLEVRFSWAEYQVAIVLYTSVVVSTATYASET